MSNNDNNDDNLQLFDWLLTNSMVDMTTTALPGNNLSGNEAFGNVNSFQALFESPLSQVMPLSPLQAIPTQQQPFDALAIDTSTQSIFSTPPSTTTRVINYTPNTQSTSSESPDGRYRNNSTGSMSHEHLQQNEQSNGEKAPEKRQEDQIDHPSEFELKKMSSKERRQLRNKISARKFRSRKKEYVTTLESDLQHQKHENERLNLEVSFVRENADKLQKERDDLKLQLALCREKNRELMRRLDKGGPSSSSSSSSKPPKNNNDDNQTPSSSSSGSNAPNTLDTNNHSSSANNKMNSLENSLPMETAVANNTVANILLPSPPSSPQHHAHYSSKPHQQDIIIPSNGDNDKKKISSVPNNCSLAAALIWTLLGYSMTILASQDSVYHDRLLPPPPPSSIDSTNPSHAQGLRMHSKFGVMQLNPTMISERPTRKNRLITLEQQPSSSIHSQLIHSHQSICRHSHQAYPPRSNIVT